MKVRNLILGMMVPVLISGCHHQARNDAYIELMGAQRRALEDRIYDLEFDYEEATAKLETLQRKNQQLRQQLDGSTNGSIPGVEIDPGKATDGAKENQGSPSGIPRIKINPGTPTDKPPKDSLEKTGAGQNFELLPAPGESATRSQPSATSTQISHIVVNPDQTGITSFGGQNNSDGLVVSLETRDRYDRYVDQPGTIIIVVLDSTQTGQAARVAHWEIPQSNVEEILNTTSGTSGITLELEWPEEPPKSSDLVLFVRYQTADGRKYETHAKIGRLPAETVSKRSHREDEATSGILNQNASDVADIETAPIPQTPPSRLHIPSAARSATAQPSASNTQSPRWRPFR